MNNVMYEPVDEICMQFVKLHEKAVLRDKIRRESFPEPEPCKPVRQIAKFEELKVESRITKPKKWYWEFSIYFMIAYGVITLVSAIINYILFAMFLFLSPGAVVAALLLRALRTIQINRMRKDDVARIKSSKEYLAEYQRRVEAQKNLQYTYDSNYESELLKYRSDWNHWKNRKQAWEDDKQKRYNHANVEYQNERSILDEMFNAFGKFPKQYQFEECVSYVRDILASSDADFNTALEMYDRERQRQLEAERIDALNRQADLQAQRNRELAYQSELQERANDIAEKHRREAAALGAYNAYQNTKQTKMMKEEQRRQKRERERYKQEHANDHIKDVVKDFNRRGRYH